MNFSLGMSEDFLSFAKLQESDLLPKQLSSHLASIGCSVNKFVGIEVICRSIRSLPPLDKILIEHRTTCKDRYHSDCAGKTDSGIVWLSNPTC